MTLQVASYGGLTMNLHAQMTCFNRSPAGLGGISYISEGVMTVMLITNVLHF